MPIHPQNDALEETAARNANVLTQNDPLLEAWLHHFYDPENHI